jgi:ADP-ribosyl-[dinitrogen reductase] hydrolase
MPSHVEHINLRLVDDPDLTSNPNLDYVLVDAARTVARLRDENKRVVLNGVAAHSRAPTVGTTYAMLRGVPLADALAAVCAALPAASPNSGFQRALERIAGRGVRSWANR